MMRARRALLGGYGVLGALVALSYYCTHIGHVVVDAGAEEDWDWWWRIGHLFDLLALTVWLACLLWAFAVPSIAFRGVGERVTWIGVTFLSWPAWAIAVLLVF